MKHQSLSVYEKEIMAVVAAIQKRRAYLLGRHFVIKTDHQSLKYLLEQKISTPMQQKWLAKLMGYDYEIQYKKGVENAVADALSRQTYGQISVISVIKSGILTKIQNSWQHDKTIQTLIHKLQDPQFSTHSSYSWKDGQLRKKNKLVVGNNPELRKTLISLWHDSAVGGHSGMEVTYRNLKAIFLFPRIEFTTNSSIPRKESETYLSSALEL
ncbi:hypothetical protein ACH5RR_018086 [Cinchona calisaya]|uniref:Reverse transcriptase RNase H-like domain-containing protein n=1 Tax=Cinchona calisaya TaxID=153742 RepID=A0ABD2ZNC2_9GENT